jgi:poly(A) polymerase
VVAKICQLYDVNNPSDVEYNRYINNLFKKFLRAMAKWKWPSPITIAKIDNYRYSPDLEPWDPSHAEHELMPVLTPAYPSKNSSYNVMRSTASLMKKEFKRAYHLSLLGKDDESFPEIFQESTFLTDYAHYIVITPTTIDKNDYNAWKGFVESKIKICIKLIESSVDGIQAIPFSKEVDGAFYIAIVKEDKEDNEDHQKEILNGCEAFLSHILSLPDTPYIKDKMDITVKTI